MIFRMRTVKFFLCTILMVCAMSSCKVYAPVYKRIENFEVHKVDRDGFRVSGDIVFYNPNKFKFHLNEILMNVEIDGKHVATAGQLHELLINRDSEFSVPLDLIIKPDMTLSEILRNIVNLIKTKQVDVTIKGTVVVRALGIKIPITVKENEKVDMVKLR